jgi:biotin synthase
MTESRLESPEYIRISLAAAMQLGYSPARFHRGARMTCINLLLTYEDGCAANCSYCGLARERRVEDERSFIRVPWPAHPTAEVVERIAASNVVKRSCLSMVTNARSLTDAITVTRQIAAATHKPVSVLINPTNVKRASLQALHYGGADRVGVAFDLPTEELFDRHRGREVRGPHRWARYWEVFKDCVEIFGPRMAGSHFIVGLGETEKEMAEAFQRVFDLGGVNHLFSFFPEQGSALESHPRPPIGVYRRIQIAAELIDTGKSTASRMRFDDAGRIADFGVSAEELESLILSGEPFRTRGCRGVDGEVACNRPYANELPGEDLRNFPFPPDGEDIALIRRQLAEG